jgi:DNA-binding NarL/FixJ family response regulator
MKIGLVLVDDHAIVREGLRALLKNDPDIQILAEAADGAQAVQVVRRLKPDVVLMDVMLPTLNGIEATKQIVKQSPKTKVIILTTMREWYKVQDCIDAGACGYFVKASPSQELLQAIHNACNGTSAFSTAISKNIQDQNRRMFITQGKFDATTPKLTTRETEVLQLIANGYGNKQIAAELGISIKTVEKHRQQVMNKLNIHDIAGLTRFAISTGMVKPSEITPRPPSNEPPELKIVPEPALQESVLVTT